nr:SOS response-associated peptidase [uncultured Desulfobulbus sp.]
MCGRFAYFGNGAFGYESLRIPLAPPFQSYNIAPSQNIPALMRSPLSRELEWAQLRWGLIPFWSKTKQSQFNLINARGEGIDSKPSFRGPFRYRRCIVFASGFYEWQKLQAGRQPYFIHPTDGGFFAFAGLWDHWEGEGGEVVLSCAIVTTRANQKIAAIHERMPVILHEAGCRLWLDAGTEKKPLLALLQPFSEDCMEVYPVSDRVNNPVNNARDCLEPIVLG